MKIRLKTWLSMALCCVPALVIATLVGIDITVAGFTVGATLGGSWSLGLIALFLLICPLYMSWMVWRLQRHQDGSGQSTRMARCCPPAAQIPAVEADTFARMQMLRRRREALEKEVAGLRHTWQTQIELEQ
jgi:type VI protein secretion system component VasK